MKENIRVCRSSGYDLQGMNEFPEADILCFPENLRSDPCEIPEGDEILNARIFAESTRSIIILPLIEKTPGGKYITTAVIDSDGEYLGKYRRVHVSREERAEFLIGDLGFPVFQASICKIGVTMSRDIYHPEPFRILSIDGAEVIFHLSSKFHRDFEYLLKAHSMMNQVVIVEVTPERSMVVEPEGTVIDVENSCFELPYGTLRNTGKRNLMGERVPHEYIRLCQRSFP